MIPRFITILISIFFFVFISGADIAFAQFGAVAEGDVSITLSPQNPGPRDPVTITIESYAIDINNATTRWYVGSTLVQEGKGIKKLITQAGDMAKPTTVRVVIQSQAGQITKTITIIPSRVSLLWEAETYTPPFFKGKSLFSHQSKITIMAEPEISANGRKVSPNNLIYTWSKDGVVLGAQNGHGKKTISFVGSVISRNMRIMVEALDPISGLTASGVTTITPIEPEVVMYVSDPLYGTQYNKAINDTIPLKGSEVTLEAVPFFFSAPSGLLSGDISYTWSINGAGISDGQNVNKRVFRKVGDVFGVSNVTLNITQLSKILQFASKNINIDFLK